MDELTFTLKRVSEKKDEIFKTKWFQKNRVKNQLQYFYKDYVRGIFKKVKRTNNLVLRKTIPLFVRETWNVNLTTLSTNPHRTNNDC